MGNRIWFIISLSFFFSFIGILTFNYVESSIDDTNWWTRVLCENGEVDNNGILHICYNETGKYKAVSDDKPIKCFGNLTSSCGYNYWHLRLQDA